MKQEINVSEQHTALVYLYWKPENTYFLFLALLDFLYDFFYDLRIIHISKFQ